MVPKTGLEPARCYAHDPESCVSTNSTTWAHPNGLLSTSTTVAGLQPPGLGFGLLFEEKEGAVTGTGKIPGQVAPNLGPIFE